MEHVAEESAPARIGVEGPTGADGAGVEHGAAVGPIPPDHLPALVGGGANGAEEVVEGGATGGPGDDAVGEALDARRVGGHGGAGRDWVGGEGGESGEADIEFVSVGHGERAVGGGAEGVAGLESGLLGMMEERVVSGFGDPGTEVAGVAVVVPTQGFEADEFPAGEAAFAEQAAALGVVAVPGFAALVGAELVAGGIHLATFHDGTIGVEADAPEERVTAEHDHATARAQEFGEAAVHFDRPVFAVTVDEEDAVVSELAGVAVEVEVGDEVVIVALLFEPGLGEAFGSGEVAVIGGVAVAEVGAGGGPGEARTDLVGAGAGDVAAVVRERGRVAGGVGQSVGAADLARTGLDAAEG